jgi:hypothetical protein
MNLDKFYNPIDFSEIVGHRPDVPKIVIENFPDFCNYGDANAHIRGFGKCIDEWCDPPIHEDVLMQLFVIFVRNMLTTSFMIYMIISSIPYMI